MASVVSIEKKDGNISLMTKTKRHGFPLDEQDMNEEK